MQINHAPIWISEIKNPFTSEQEKIFKKLLRRMEEEAITPTGYAVLPDEMESEYVPYEIIRNSIKRGGKELQIALPKEVWHPRAVQWVQGLYAMNAVLHCMELQ
ncbi:hypothetical protein NMY22_g9659 [Coprinellus aureogranulatus]|nr:hypothetical protein NMY22_g9659 [Coprinellus aureogranulatus]